MIESQSLQKISVESVRVSEDLRHAWLDLLEGCKAWRVWLLLAWQDIRLRYRRSTLGPFWITLSMAITIYSMGLLYSKLFKMDLNQYYPFLATGMLSWNLISSLLSDAPTIFVDAESFIKQIKQPYCSFIFRAVARNLIIFAHNTLVLVPIMIFFHMPFHYVSLLFGLSLLLIVLNASGYGMLLAILGTRFRDIAQLVTSLLQVIFFLTPIMWSSKVLSQKYQFVVELNPFAHMLNLIRDPLLGIVPPLYSWLVILGITAFGLLAAFIVFARYRARIAYWL